MAVDYDPQKAHLYYLKHRKLKGKNSTKGMSKSQKEQWSYAKDQLKQEHKEINAGITQASSVQRQKLSEDAKRKRERLTNQANAAIERLRNQLANMSPEQKALVKDRIQGMISDIRGDVRQDKADLSASTKTAREGIAEDAKTARAKEAKDYEARKDQAYKKIKGK